MKKIVCVGEMLIDFMGLSRGKSLKDQDHFNKQAGGAPANVACTISALEGSCYFLGSIGQDGFGDFLKEELETFGVSTALLKRSQKPTTLAFVSIDEEGEREFAFVRGADADLEYDWINQKHLEAVEIIHFGAATAFLEGPLQDTYHCLLDQAQREGKLIVFDPNYRNDFWKEDIDDFKDRVLPFIRKAHLVKLSDEEALIVTGQSDLESAIQELKHMSSATFTITLGKEGVRLFNPHWDEHVTTEKIEVKDTTGAGDAFIGAVIYQLAQYNDMPSILEDKEKMIAISRFANQIAGKVCTRVGALSAIKDLLK